MRISFLDMPDVKMTFTEHLAELRTRILRSLIAVGVFGTVAFVFTNEIFQFLRKPLGPEVTL